MIKLQDYFDSFPYKNNKNSYCFLLIHSQKIDNTFINFYSYVFNDPKDLNKLWIYSPEQEFEINGQKRNKSHLLQQVTLLTHNINLETVVKNKSICQFQSVNFYNNEVISIELNNNNYLDLKNNEQFKKDKFKLIYYDKFI